MDLINKNFFQDISELLDSARKQAKTAVNLSMHITRLDVGFTKKNSKEKNVLNMESIFWKNCQIICWRNMERDFRLQI